MKIMILFFSSAREITGVNNYDMIVTDGMIMNEILAQIYDIFPRLKSCNFKIALNKKYIKTEDMNQIILKDGDVIACIPPISGG